MMTEDFEKRKAKNTIEETYYRVDADYDVKVVISQGQIV